MKYKSTLIFLLSLMVSKAGFGADCRSELSARLKPLGSHDRLSWALESVLTLGEMNGSSINRSFNTQMLFGGFDLIHGNHELYLEGGAKFWYRSDEDEKMGSGNGSGTGLWSDYSKPLKKNAGMRELYYGYSGSLNQLKLGLQSMKLGKSMLLDERVLGIGYERQTGALQFELKSGTVSTRFSRMGDFCGTRHVYRLLQGGRYDLAARELWQTNFTGAIIIWDRTDHASSEGGGFENFDDGFGDFGDSDTASEPVVQNVSLIFYDEFDADFQAAKYYFGALTELNLKAGAKGTAEMVYQHIEDNQSAAFRLECSRDWSWASGAVSRIRMTGFLNMNKGRRFYPAFSNLFAGEFLRLDLYDMPLGMLSLSHQFQVPLKPGLKIQYLKQLKYDQAEEVDVQLNLKMVKGLHGYFIYSRIQSDSLNGLTHIFKSEARWAF